MTPQDLRRARRKLGLSQMGLAGLLRLGSARTVRRWEREGKDIPGPVAILIETWLRFPITLQIAEKAAGEKS